jgi:threonine dehydrogenase-like Zn-dependent dehydrogenase
VFGSEAGEFGGQVGIDIIVETAGTWTAMRVASELVRAEGRIVIVALHPDPPEFNVIGDSFFRKLYTLISSSYPPPGDFPPERTRFTLRRTCDDVMDYLCGGRMSYESAITHRVHYTELPELYSRLDEGEGSIVGVIVEWESLPARKGSTLTSITRL